MWGVKVDGVFLRVKGSPWLFKNRGNAAIVALLVYECDSTADIEVRVFEEELKIEPS